eukprot:3179897-Amphidinium_carterae.2
MEKAAPKHGKALILANGEDGQMVETIARETWPLLCQLLIERYQAECHVSPVFLLTGSCKSHVGCSSGQIPACGKSVP